MNPPFTFEVYGNPPMYYTVISLECVITFHSMTWWTQRTRYDSRLWDRRWPLGDNVYYVPPIGVLEPASCDSFTDLFPQVNANATLVSANL